MDLISIYSIPVWDMIYPSFDVEKNIFLTSVDEYMQENPDFSDEGTTNQSAPLLHSKEKLKPFFDYIYQASNKIADDLNFIDRDIYITSSWVTYHNLRNHIKPEHIHHEVFSGVFYLQCPEKSAKLRIKNPGMNPLWNGLILREDKNQFTSESITIEPKEGQIIIWPSYLPHSVETNDHDKNRISISFNILMLPKARTENTIN